MAALFVFDTFTTEERDHNAARMKIEQHVRVYRRLIERYLKWQFSRLTAILGGREASAWRRAMQVCIVFPPIAVFAILMSETPLIQSVRSGFDDKLMFIAAPSVLPDAAIGTTLVELDDDTMIAHWNVQTGGTPRDKLAQVMRQLLQRKPRYLVVDIALTRYDSDPEGERAMRAVLSDSALIGDTDILLVRDHLPGNPWPPGPEKCIGPIKRPPWTQEERAMDVPHIFPSSCFDDVVEGGPARSHLFWVSEELGSRDSDNLVRSMPREWLGCSRQLRVIFQWAPGYLIRILEKARVTRVDRKKLVDSITRQYSRQIARRNPERIRGCRFLYQQDTREANIVMTSQQITTDHWFRNHYSSPEWSHIAFKYDTCWNENSDTTCNLDRVSAHELGSSDCRGDFESMAPGCRLIRDRLVIIARTDADSKDWFETPAGKLPGGALLAEAIYTVTSLPNPLLPSQVLGILTLFGAFFLLATEVFVEIIPYRTAILFIIYILLSSMSWIIFLYYSILIDISTALFTMGVARFFIDFNLDDFIKREA